MNGWVDYANFSLRNNHSVLFQELTAYDDYDTFYEWISEEVFDLENAIPEQKGDTDDSKKISPLKITLACADELHQMPELLRWHLHPRFSLFLQWPVSSMNIWDPPPNV